MTAALIVINWAAALVVLAEAMNKLERSAPLRAGLCSHTRLVESLKAVAWLLLALGSAGELAAPIIAVCGIEPGVAVIFLGEPKPSLTGTSVLLGFAVLIIRTRVKEG